MSATIQFSDGFDFVCENCGGLAKMHGPTPEDWPECEGCGHPPYQCKCEIREGWKELKEQIQKYAEKLE